MASQHFIRYPRLTTPESPHFPSAFSLHTVGSSRSTSRHQYTRCSVPPVWRRQHLAHTCWNRLDLAPDHQGRIAGHVWHFFLLSFSGSLSLARRQSLPTLGQRMGGWPHASMRQFPPQFLPRPSLAQPIPCGNGSEGGVHTCVRARFGLVLCRRDRACLHMGLAHGSATWTPEKAPSLASGVTPVPQWVYSVCAKLQDMTRSSAVTL